MPIKNIIFDFGDVLINLDKTFLTKQLKKITTDPEVISVLDQLNKKYEVGAISTSQFLDALQNQLPELQQDQLVELWNGMLLDFPIYRLDFLLKLRNSSSYRLFLLSNTNELHIANVQSVMKSSYTVFKESFEGFYLSHEIHLRKPDAGVFEYVLDRHDLKPNETLFIDDTLENVTAAKQLGIYGWHLQVGKEDVIELERKIVELISH
ncbi:MAG: HAD family phosphatase [Nonlabens sp.]